VPEPEPQRRTYTIEEAGRKLGIGRNQAYDAARRKEIPTIRIGRRQLVPALALDRLLDGLALQPSIPADHDPRDISAQTESAPSQSDRNARQRLRDLMAAAISEANGDQEAAVRLFVDALLQQDDRAALTWSLCARGRADAIRRLFMKVTTSPEAGSSGPREVPSAPSQPPATPRRTPRPTRTPAEFRRRPSSPEFK
jgi:excisionase family DNA binding protein